MNRLFRDARIRSVYCLALALSGVTIVSGGVAQPPSVPALRVVIVPSRRNVRLRETFGLGLRVENPTLTNQTVRVMCCSWQDEWQISNPRIPWGGADCPKNFAMDVQILPGGAYTNYESGMCIYDLIPDKELSFRMGFTSIGSTNTYWSNEVKLHILPPDTWQQGAKYYRDRNHDGKIDWEVSGSTWMGNTIVNYITNSNGSLSAHEEWTGQGVDTYKVDTNYDGFYDLEYGAGGTNGQIQWTTNIHERVPVVGKDFVPTAKASWMDYWTK